MLINASVLDNALVYRKIFQVRNLPSHQQIIMMKKMKDQLAKHLKEGAAWEEMETPIPGVFIVKAPGPKSNPKGGKLMMKINPVDETGKPKKKKGLFLSDRETYIQYYEILSDDRINKILVTLEEVNPKATKKTKKKLKMD